MLFFSDLHCHAWSQYSTRLPNGLNSRLQDCLNIIHQAKKIVEEQLVNYVFFVGDLFHSRTKIDIDVYYATFRAMRDLASIGVPIYILKGNHDCHNRVGDVHSLEAFKTIAAVVDRPMIRTLQSGDEKVSVAMFPYTSDVPRLIEQFEGLPAMDLVLFHQGVREAVVGPYGMTVHSELALSNLPLNRVRYCIAGDYHKRQFLADGKFHYCGSPLQLTFGEAGEEKAFSLIDTSDWKIQTIPTSAPRFYSFDSATRLAEVINTPDSPNLDVDFIRVFYKNENEINETIRALEGRIVFEHMPEEQTVLTRIDPAIVGDDRALLEAWLHQKVGDSQDAGNLIELGMELLATASAE